jgi:uncharacterized protein DUF2188
MRTKGKRKTYLVAPRPEGGWKVLAEGVKRASSVHRTKAEALWQQLRRRPGAKRQANCWSTKRMG